MIKLTERYAKALLDFAREHGMGEVYRQALAVVLGGVTDPALYPEALGSFLTLIPGGGEEVLAVLYRFLDLARDQMDMLETEIISAVPLRPEQLRRVEETLIRIFRKQLDITATVDPSLLGGLRVIVGGTVLDDTIKRKLSDMKTHIYEGVYFQQ